MLTENEKTGLIRAYGNLITSRNALISQYKKDNLTGLVNRLKNAQKADWETVGKLREEIKTALEGEKELR